MPMSYNAWLYGYGNPVNSSDASGLCKDTDNDGICDALNYPGYYTGFAFADFDETSGTFTMQEKIAINGALFNIADDYSRAYNNYVDGMRSDCWMWYSFIPDPKKMGSVAAFITLHGGRVTFKKFNTDPKYNGEGRSPRLIWLYQNGSLIGGYNNDYLRFQRFITHEMGHAFELALLGALGNRLGRRAINYDEYIYLKTPRKYLPSHNAETNGGYEDDPEANGKYYGFAGGADNWQFRLANQQYFPGEIFADMFVGWAYNRWETDENGDLIKIAQDRADFMDKYMSLWIYNAIQSRIRNIDE